jgi:uncharacterized protein (TIGR03435 family)
MKRIWRLGLILISAVPAGAPAQSLPTPPQFEVASVKRSDLRTGRVGHKFTRGRSEYWNVSLLELLMQAFGVQQYRIDGPSWLTSNVYSIVATYPAETPAAQRTLMLRSLLVDRFGLQFHFVKKELPVYALVVDRGGPKLKRVQVVGSEAIHTTISSSAGSLRLPSAGMVSLASTLMSWLDRPVEDHTNLEGSFDVTLNWMTDEQNEAARQAGRQTYPDLFEAIRQQLGLKLQRQTSSVECLVIDHVNPTPVEN